MRKCTVCLKQPNGYAKSALGYVSYLVLRVQVLTRDRNEGIIGQVSSERYQHQGLPDKGSIASKGQCEKAESGGRNVTGAIFSMPREAVFPEFGSRKDEDGNCH